MVVVIVVLARLALVFGGCVGQLDAADTRGGLIGVVGTGVGLSIGRSSGPTQQLLEAVGPA